MAWAEAAIDFSDEEIPEDVLGRVRVAIWEISQEIQSHLHDNHRGEIVRDGVHLTVIGNPNAGKSSLVNALARRDVAIVSETAGTTRDVIEVRLDLELPRHNRGHGGITGFLRPHRTRGCPPRTCPCRGGRSGDFVQDGSAPDAAEFAKADLIVWNKADLPWPKPRNGIRLSLKTGEGLDALIAALTVKVAEKLEAPTEAPPITRARHRHALEDTAQALARAEKAAEPELMAEDLGSPCGQWADYRQG